MPPLRYFYCTYLCIPWVSIPIAAAAAAAAPLAFVDIFEPKLPSPPPP